VKVNDFFWLIIQCLFLKVSFVLPHTTEVKDVELFVFCFCFAGEDGERNGWCYGFSVQCQNQSGGHHGAFCKGNTYSALYILLLEIHSTLNPWPQGHLTGYYLLWLIQGDSPYILGRKMTTKVIVYYCLAKWLFNFQWSQISGCSLNICLAYTLKVKALMSSKAVKIFRF
jgi:hypothetical protein